MLAWHYTAPGLQQLHPPPPLSLYCYRMQLFPCHAALKGQRDASPAELDPLQEAAQIRRRVLRTIFAFAQESTSASSTRHLRLCCPASSFNLSERSTGLPLPHMPPPSCPHPHTIGPTSQTTPQPSKDSRPFRRFRGRVGEGERRRLGEG